MNRPDAALPSSASQAARGRYVGFRSVTAETPGLAVGMSMNTLSDSIEFSLTEHADRHPEVFEAAFNSGNAALVAQVYEDAAAFVPSPGVPVTGDELHDASAGFLALGLPITVRLRHGYVAGDIALLVVDWSIDGPGPDGEPVHLEGTATDVARRGPDGLWRYVIDNPFGTAAGRIRPPEPLDLGGRLPGGSGSASQQVGCTRIRGATSTDEPSSTYGAAVSSDGPYVDPLHVRPHHLT